MQPFINSNQEQKSYNLQFLSEKAIQSPNSSDACRKFNIPQPTFLHQSTNTPTSPPCMRLYPANNLLHQFPNLILGQFKKKSAEYRTETFFLTLNFKNNHECRLFNMSSIKIELFIKDKFLLEYHNSKIFLVKKKENEVVIKVEKHNLSFANEPMKKTVNKRVDGVKSDVNKFIKLMRILSVSFMSENYSFNFQLPVVCCSPGAFNTPLLIYRKIKSKEEELISFLEEELPKPHYSMLDITPYHWMAIPEIEPSLQFDVHERDLPSPVTSTCPSENDANTCQSDMKSTEKYAEREEEMSLEDFLNFSKIEASFSF